MSILSDGKPGVVVPYRDSKLTRLLQVGGFEDPDWQTDMNCSI